MNVTKKKTAKPPISAEREAHLLRTIDAMAKVVAAAREVTQIEPGRFMQLMDGIKELSSAINRYDRETGQ